MIKTVDNFQAKLEVNLQINTNNKNWYFEANKKDIKNINITLESFKQNTNNILVFDDKKEEDNRILSIEQINNYHKIEVGNYIGKFKHNGIDIDIKSRFSNKFLTRMLNFANDIYLDNISVFKAEEKKSKEIDYSKFVIYHLFIQKLEKAFLLGLPKSYRTIEHHDIKLKGKIDINRFIKHDIPFKGKISSNSREQKEIQEIIDVLHKAVSIIEKNNFNTKNISNIKIHLKQNKSNSYVSNETINKAIKSKALQNKIFSPYKKVLEYAKFIINGNNIEQKDNGNQETYGFLVNVAELFEIYVTKLLQKEFTEWSIESPHLKLDKEFYDCSYLYNRKIIPDITMIHNDSKNVMVFDTKYKRMKFNEQYGSGSDIDRCDFFQINTYMNYYNNQDNYNLIGGGLLYPIEATFNIDKAHSNSWFGNDKVAFIVDGIELSKENLSMNDILISEDNFINRIKGIINNKT